MTIGPYARLSLMAGLSFAAMYALMYAMVNSFENIYPNVNQLYMAGLMTAAMVLIELALMRPMYQRRTLNVAIAATSLFAMAVCWLLLRAQAAVSDEQFLKAMIPHHAGAILMCRRAPLKDSDVRNLCVSIVESQQREIHQMSAKLAEMRRPSS